MMVITVAMVTPSEAHTVGQMAEGMVSEECGAGQVQFAGLQSEGLQLMAEQAELFTLAATFILQLAHLRLKTAQREIEVHTHTYIQRI